MGQCAPVFICKYPKPSISIKNRLQQITTTSLFLIHTLLYLHIINISALKKSDGITFAKVNGDSFRLTFAERMKHENYHWCYQRT